MFEGIQMMIEVPLGYTQRDQLLGFMESKFPGAQISIAHSRGREADDCGSAYSARFND